MSHNVPRTTRHDIVQLPESGTTLEYILIQRPATSLSTEHNEPRRKLAICLHPWSWLGGRINDPVLQLLTEPLLEKGYDVIRYNSRGVGKSSGWASLTGNQEAEDLKKLVQWARTTLPNVSSVVIAGYSYGSLIASLHSIIENVPTSHILLSYPMGPRHWLTAFHGSRYTAALQALVRNPRSNVLVIYGNEDNFTSEGVYDAWATTLHAVHGAATEDATPASLGRLEIEKIEGASHFWREDDAVDRLLNRVRNWLP